MFALSRKICTFSLAALVTTGIASDTNSIDENSIQLVKQSWDGSLVPVQPDFATLALKVTNVRLEKEIKREGFADRSTVVGAKKGYKLVVVTLEGTSPSEGLYIYTDLFALLYESEIVQTHGKSAGEHELVQKFAHCCAIKTKFGWSISEEGSTWTSTTLLSPGPFTIEIAAVVPKEARSCLVIIPTVAQGQARIPDLTNSSPKQPEHTPTATEEPISSEDEYHLKRVAKFEEMRDSANEKGDTETVARANRLLEREYKRHEDIIKRLQERKQRIQQRGEGAGDNNQKL